MLAANVYLIGSNAENDVVFVFPPPICGAIIFGLVRSLFAVVHSFFGLVHSFSVLFCVVCEACEVCMLCAVCAVWRVRFLVWCVRFLV